MGLVYAKIELINGFDLELARNKMLDEDKVKRMTVKMLVDSGAYMLRINEDIQDQLRFPVVGRKTAKLATGQVVELDIVKLVEVRFENRDTECRAMVLPGDTEPLLGAIPMEDMDVLIHPKRRKLIVNPAHPYRAQTILK